MLEIEGCLEYGQPSSERKDVASLLGRQGDGGNGPCWW